MKKYNCVVINGKFLTQKITGVQRFALESIKALDKIVSKDNNFILAVPSEVDFTPLGTLQNISIEKVGRKTGILWEQTELSNFINSSSLKIFLDAFLTINSFIKLL